MTGSVKTGQFTSDQRERQGKEVEKFGWVGLHILITYNKYYYVYIVCMWNFREWMNKEHVFYLVLTTENDHG